MFQLQLATHNTGIFDNAFRDAPKRLPELLDVRALLREVGRNQDEVEKRFTEYAFTQKKLFAMFTDKGRNKRRKTANSMKRFRWLIVNLS